MEEKEIIRSSQLRFTKGKSYTANLMSFYNEITRLVDEGGAMDIVFLDFSNAFDAVPHKILIGKMGWMRRQCGVSKLAKWPDPEGSD